MQKFLNGIDMNRLYPDTFHIPSEQDKKEIIKGNYVKVGFIDSGDDVERMWLIVEEVTEDGIKGKLANAPVFFDYEMGDVFQIRNENILSIIKE